MSKLSISNVVRVSILSALRGLSGVNTSALGLITSEEPIPSNFGVFREYLDPTGVANDFGSDSATYRLAVQVFSQNPNIITGGGSLLIVPRLQSAPASPAVIYSRSNVDLTALPATDYHISAEVDGAAATDIEIGQLNLNSLLEAQESLNSTAIIGAGLEFELTGELSAAQVVLKTISTGSTSSVVISAAGTGTDASPLLLIDGASANGADAGVEAIKDAILRTYQTAGYFGIIYDEKPADAVLPEISALVQSIDKIQFIGSSVQADLAGIFTTLKDSGYTLTRGLYYSESADDALDFAAGYASRGLSINFSGANTALTMHLKEIVGLTGDSGLNQTLLTAAKNAGVDVYANFGVPKVYTSGANQYFDQVYTRTALKLRLQVAGFNFLATSPTKIPQTESGMTGLKGAYRQVLRQFVTAGVFAPGTWLSATTFGNPEDHIRNIQDQGYYVYSLPISQQSLADRTARVAPLVQIAAKDAGAIHSSDVVVFVEA